MATLDELTTAGQIKRVANESVLGPSQQAFRRVYYSLEVANWIAKALPHIVCDGYVAGAMSPQEQAFGALRDFISGCPPSDFEKPPCRLYPEQLGVWELRTADLRLFGVFPKRDNYLWISACTKTQAMKNSNQGYANHQSTNLQFVAALNLDTPKMLYGELQDVLTF